MSNASKSNRNQTGRGTSAATKSTEKKTPAKKGERDAWSIVSHPEKFYRAGRKFTRQPTVIAKDELSEDETSLLLSEPSLTVTISTVLAAALDED